MKGVCTGHGRARRPVGPSEVFLRTVDAWPGCHQASGQLVAVAQPRGESGVGVGVARRLLELRAPSRTPILAQLPQPSSVRGRLASIQHPGGSWADRAMVDVNLDMLCARER